MWCREKKITVQLVGGIGNQLFQYFAGRYLAQINHCNLLLDTSRIGVGGRDHGSSLSHIYPDESFRKSVWKKYFYRSIFGRSHYFLLRKFPSYRAIVSKIIGLYQSPVLGFDQNLAHQIPPITIAGYFQTDTYYNFLRAKGMTLPELRSPSEWFRAVENVIASNRSLIVHVRRGDYVPLRDSFGLLSRNYYQNSLDVLSKAVHYTHVFVFSDDLEVARSMNLELKGAEIHYVQPPSSVAAIESMLLMSKGKAIVLSNSTFAWWAATIGDFEVVVAPSQWFRKSESPEGIEGASWLKIESDWED